MCFVKIFSTRRKVILKQILNLYINFSSSIALSWFDSVAIFSWKTLEFFPIYLNICKWKMWKTFFFSKKSSLNFQNLFKEKDRSISVFNLFWSPKGRNVCKRTDLISHKSWINEKKRRREKKLLSYLCVLHFTNLWARWIWKKNIPHSFSISGSSDFVENHQIQILLSKLLIW